MLSSVSIRFSARYASTLRYYAKLYLDLPNPRLISLHPCHNIAYTPYVGVYMVLKSILIIVIHCGTAEDGYVQTGTEPEIFKIGRLMIICLVFKRWRFTTKVCCVILYSDEVLKLKWTEGVLLTTEIPFRS
jgi:hypothetical protein